MTEADWLRCTYPREMLTHLGRDPVDRKYRLFACACLRRCLDDFASDELLNAVESAERFAQGETDVLPPPDAFDFAPELAHSPAYTHLLEAVYVVLNPQLLSPYLAAVAAEQVMAAFEVGGFGFSATEERGLKCDLLRDIVGNPFRPVAFDPAWRSANVRALAAAIYVDSGYDRLPILADALEEAGCTRPDVLEHCREPAEHVRGCWVIDGLLEK